MVRRIGLLSVSMAALALAVAGYFIQGAGAETSPVEVADFGVSPSAVAAATGGDEYDEMPGDTALFHPAATPPAAACAKSAGLGLIALTEEIAILCKDEKVLGYLVTAESGETKLVDSIQPKEDCPSEKQEEQPDA